MIFSITQMTFNLYVVLVHLSFGLIMSESAVSEINWDMCVICQERKNESLVCPGNTKPSHPGFGKGYTTFNNDINSFIDSDICLPVPLNIDCMKGESNIEDTLTKQKAKWHKSCRVKFSPVMLQRAVKRNADGNNNQINTLVTPPKVTRKSLGSPILPKEQICFICDSSVNEWNQDSLHKVSTFRTDKKVRACAHILQDSLLSAKLSIGDLISQDALYHRNCLITLYRKADNELQDSTNEFRIDQEIHGIAFAELIGYISETHEDNVLVFKLSALTKLYKERYVQLGGDEATRIHSTRLKHRILGYFTDMHAYNEGRDVLLAFDDDVGIALKHLDEYIDYDNDAVILGKAANIVRRDMFQDSANSFNGSFQRNCQHTATPKSLQTLVEMTLSGCNIKKQKPNTSEFQVAMSIAQLIMFNSTSRRRDSCKNVYNRRQRETPLPVYTALKIHAETRKRELVEQLHELGICISYGRLLDISTAVANSVCQMYHDLGVVCPPSLQHGYFTTAAVDNIDHNPSSTTAQGALHGTGISLFQHGIECTQDEYTTSVPYQETSEKTLNPLPNSYTTVTPVSKWTQEPTLPRLAHAMSTSSTHVFDSAMEKEQMWLDHVCGNIGAYSDSDNSTRESCEAISWPVFHSQHSSVTRHTNIDKTAMLPMFEEEAKSVAMIRHSIDVIRNAVHHVNPDQTPVIACDQPLYAIAKQVQWNWPYEYGEDKVFILFGGLHTEMNAWKTVGDWLEGSGWVEMVSKSNLATAGKADSFLKASHVSRTRHAHQVTACCLYILQQNAYTEYIHSTIEKSDHDNILDFDEWVENRVRDSPQFQYWNISLKFIQTVLIFVRSLREGNFKLYVESLRSLTPWFFALDHTNYARWLSVHLRDIAELPERNPDVYDAFCEGKFVVHKTERNFSGIAVDHAHEQNNRCVKEDGGAIGLTENSSQLLRWMVAGPEIARIVNEFEVSQGNLKHSPSKPSDTGHHEESFSYQKRFASQVVSLVETIEELGNPFKDDSNELTHLENRDIADERVVHTVREIERVGKEQFNSFVQQRLVSHENRNGHTEDEIVSLSKPIKKNKFPLFSLPKSRGGRMSRDKESISSLKKSCAIFSQMYIACQVRNGNLEEFFMHENDSYPPALSTFGRLRSSAQKSKLLTALKETYADITAVESPQVDVVILDGSAIVNMLKPGSTKTFKSYAADVFEPYIMNYLNRCRRVDIVWDTYKDDSFKAFTRESRGEGFRRRVLSDSSIPSNWQSFLRNDDNKTELFTYLANESVLIDPALGQIVSTCNDTVLSNVPQYDSRTVSPCNHEEADSRMLLHAYDCIKNNSISKVLLRTVDTDVIVLAISYFHQFSQIGVQEMWVAFGVGDHFTYYSIHKLARYLGERKSKALAGFHAFTGCDTTSYFTNKGKKTAFETYNLYEESINAFIAMTTPLTIEQLYTIKPILERFVVIMYDRTSESDSVNSCRQELFSQKGRQIDFIPPTAAALSEHTKRSVLQSGYIWGQCLVAIQDVPNPMDWGWTRSKDNKLTPYWTSLPEAQKVCREFIKCGCQSLRGCFGRCKCTKAGLPCTSYCKCKGSCEQPF